MLTIIKSDTSYTLYYYGTYYTLHPLKFYHIGYYNYNNINSCAFFNTNFYSIMAAIPMQLNVASLLTRKSKFSYLLVFYDLKILWLPTHKSSRKFVFYSRLRWLFGFRRHLGD